MLLEEICSLPAIIGKTTVIAFQQEHIREQDVQEYEFHVIDTSISDDWFLYHFDLKNKTCLSKKPETNHKNDDTGCNDDYENNFKSCYSHQKWTVEVTVEEEKTKCKLPTDFLKCPRSYSCVTETYFTGLSRYAKKR